ncbi:excisionase family DNA-binding protein [Propionimicrobium sp. PCR01-08-3]|uniref:excisionase family DNA-binding protein n=1 Tax=Propionimicrobium sp. PCR01-08-3 TaxID=3052086 RepID=UPI00255C3337|nr:excisionase family DNA-binding protein [Propionimicrobium sp. PCR01-08-3]WIY82418.1 excisionase family DNA-binding protein [Propionimicrobium sp. PCR01-08-3]
MNTQVMTLAPDALRDTPRGESVWEKALIEFIRRASAEGKTIIVSTEVETLTPEEVARGLNLSRSTVSRRIADGTIQSVKVGNRHHVPYPEYRRLWEESMTKAAAASMADIEAELFNDE